MTDNNLPAPVDAPREIAALPPLIAPKPAPVVMADPVITAAEVAPVPALVVTVDPTAPNGDDAAIAISKIEADGSLTLHSITTVPAAAVAAPAVVDAPHPDIEAALVAAMAAPVTPSLADIAKIPASAQAWSDFSASIRATSIAVPPIDLDKVSSPDFKSTKDLDAWRATQASAPVAVDPDAPLPVTPLPEKKPSVAAAAGNLALIALLLGGIGYAGHRAYNSVMHRHAVKVTAAADSLAPVRVVPLPAAPPKDIWATVPTFQPSASQEPQPSLPSAEAPVAPAPSRVEAQANAVAPAPVPAPAVLPPVVVSGPASPPKAVAPVHRRHATLVRRAPLPIAPVEMTVAPEHYDEPAPEPEVGLFASFLRACARFAGLQAD